MGRSADRVGTVNLRAFHIGVDLGQRVVCTSKRSPVTYEFERERKLMVRLVERVRLGQGFGEIVDEVARLTHSQVFAGDLVTTSVDTTGMGIVVTEELRRARLKGELYPVVITGGLEGRYSAGYFPTPRTELLLGVQQAFEREGLGKVQSVRGPRFETMGAHDDLVFALGLALFGVRSRF